MLRPTNSAIGALLQGRQLGSTTPRAAAGEGEDFGKDLVQALKDVNQAQMDSKGLQEDFMTNRKPVEVHDLMIAMEKAGTSMQLTMSVRNKVLEAYQEISKMQI